MKQGEIWQANLNPTKGSEQRGIRPVLIVSGNLMNQYLSVVIVCLLTSKIKKYKGNLILKPSNQNGLKQESEVLNFHIRSISKVRLLKKMGEITDDEIAKTKKGINEILSY